MKTKSKVDKRSGAERIVRTLRKNGHEAYFVGGCVRDRVLKKKPSDYDIATSAVPAEVKKCFERSIAVGEAFGVMMVLMDGLPYEVATFRTESDYRDGRHPDKVSFSDAKSDCLRRDFTVNGLFYDPVSKKVLDWVGGVRDIRKRIIRTIGKAETRFEEDKLRMLRAVRFAVNLNFKLEPSTLRAIRRMRKQIKSVSSERIREELVKLLTGPYPGRGLKLLDESGLLEVILPEISAMKGVKQPPQFHPEGDVFVHTCLMLSLLKNPPVELALGSLFHDVGKPATFRRAKDRIRFDGHDFVGARMTEKILERLKFSNEIKEKVVACVEGHMRFKDTPKMKASTLKRMLQRPTFEVEMEQHRVDCLASHKNLMVWRFLKKKLKSLSQEEIKPEPLLKGKDLITLGLKPGPLFGKILKQLEDEQLEGKITTHEQALAWAKRKFIP